MGAYTVDQNKENFQPSVEDLSGTITTDGNDSLQWYHDKIDDWKSKKLVREVRAAVPEGILPPGYIGELRDIKVETKGGPDDAFFKANKDLQQFMTRGLTVLDLNNGAGCLHSDIVISANKKFYEFEKINGGVFNIHEDGLANLFIADPSNVQRVIAMEKLNGEAAHFSGRFINNEFYIITGSKNVHLIVKDETEVEKYSETRYDIARKIAYELLRKMNEMSNSIRKEFQTFLHETRNTAICEILMPDRQHVVNIAENQNDELYVFAMTAQPNMHSTSLTALSSEETLEKFVHFGFNIPVYRYLEINEMNDDIDEVLKSENTEGVVYYFEDGDKNTTCLLKLKSRWYVHLRALREQANFRHAGKKNIKQMKSLEFHKNRSRQRMEDIQKWLHTSNEELELWKQRSDAWMERIEQEIKSQRIPKDRIRSNFPVIWKQLAVA